MFLPAAGVSCHEMAIHTLRLTSTSTARPTTFWVGCRSQPGASGAGTCSTPRHGATSRRCWRRFNPVSSSRGISTWRRPRHSWRRATMAAPRLSPTPPTNGCSTASTTLARWCLPPPGCRKPSSARCARPCNPSCATLRAPTISWPSRNLYARCTRRGATPPSRARPRIWASTASALPSRLTSFPANGRGDCSLPDNCGKARAPR